VRTPLLVLALLAGGCSPPLHHSREAIESLKAPMPPITRVRVFGVAPSGMRLVSYQHPGERHVTLRLTLRHGAIDDPPGKEGLARLAVRTALRAPTGTGGAGVEERLFALGALYDARVGADELSFQVTCRPAQLAPAVTALTGLLHGLEDRIDEAAVRDARGQLAYALELEHQGQAGQRQQVLARALAGSPYGRAPATPETLAAITLDDVRAAMRQAFRPERAVLAVTGGQPAGALQQAVSAAVPAAVMGTPADPGSPDGAAPAVAVTPRPVAAIETVATPGSARSLWLAWPVPGAREGQEAVEAAAAEQLEWWLRRRVFQARSDEVLSVQAWAEVMDGASVILARVRLGKAADPERVRRTLVDGAGKAARLLDEGRFARGSQDGVYAAAASGGLGDEGRCVRITGAPDALQRAVTQAAGLRRSLRPFLESWIAPGPSVVLLFAPAPDDEPVELEAPRTAAGTVTVTADPLAVAAPGAAEVLRLLEPPGLDAAHREPLPGGAELVVLPRQGLPFVTGHVLLPGGGALPSERFILRLGLMSTRGQLQAGGCWGASPAVALADAAILSEADTAQRVTYLVESMGCWSGADRDWSEVRLAEATGDWRIPLALEALAMGRPAPAPTDRPDFGAIGRGYLGRALQPAGAQVILTGAVEPSVGLSAAARRAFAAWGRPAEEPVAPPAQPSWPTARRVVVVDIPGARRAVAVVLVRTPPELGSSAAGEVLRRLAAQQIGLADAAAGLEGEVYQGTILGGAWLAVTSQGPRDRLAPAVERSLSLLASLTTQAPAAAMVDHARWNSARQQAYRFDTAEGAALGLVQLAAAGLPPDAWERYPAELAAVTPAVVQAAARTMAVGREAILVVGDAAALVPALTAKGLASEVVAAPPKKK